MGLRCSICDGFFSDGDPTLVDVVPGINRAGTCVCARCDEKRKRVPLPNEPTEPGFYWHRCEAGFTEGASWHPVDVRRLLPNREQLFVGHFAADDGYDDLEDIGGEWGPQIPDFAPEALG